MVLLALDLFNIPPFGRSKRISFAPGLNCVVGPNGSGKTRIYQILSSILFNTEALFDNELAQVALTLRTPQADIFRIARFYQKQAWDLSRMTAETKKFTTIETDQALIQGWFRKEAGGLADKDRHLLFLLDQFRLPSQVLQSGSDAVLPVPHFNSDEMQASLDLKKDPLFSPQKKEETQSLNPETEIELALKVAEAKLEAMEEESDSLLQKQDQIASLKKRVAQYQEIELKLSQIEETEAKKYALFASQKPLEATLIQDYEASEKLLAQTLAEIDEARENLQSDLDMIIEVPLAKDRLILAGLGLFVFSFLLPFIVTLAGSLRYLFLAGVVIGSGLAAFAYYKRMRRAAVKKTLRRKQAALEQKAQDAKNRFETEHKTLVDFMQMLCVENLAELKKILSAHANLLKKKTSVQSEKEHFLKKQSIEEMNVVLSGLEKDAAALEEKLVSLGSVSQEVYRLREEIREGDASDDPLEDSILPLSGFAAPNEAVNLSFFSTLLAIAKSAGGRPDRQRLQQNAGQVFRYFQSGTAETIHLEENGEVFVGKTPLNRLSAGIADQVFFSLVLSSLEQFKEVPMPFLLDDPFARFDARSKLLAGKILQEISKKRQVILFTADALSSCNTARFVNLDS